MSSNLDNTVKNLKRRFSIYMVIVGVLFIGDVFCHYSSVSIEPPLMSLKNWGYFLFVISIFTGVGVPIFLRMSFQRNAARAGFATIDGYLRLQRLLLVSILISCISADIAYFFPVHTLYLYGAFFSCLYGIYSVIPYRKKIASEMRFYKLID